MKRSFARVIAAGFPALLSLAACSARKPQPAPVVQAHTSEETMRLPAADVRPDSARHGYTAADVRFIHHMLAHHAQALAMTSLVPARTTRPDMRLLAERIDVSQKSEIAMMQRWLKARGEEIPDFAAHHDMSGHVMTGHDMSTPAASTAGTSMHGMLMPGMLMPGMLTPEQMAALSSASGPEFDRLFLEGMIQHHEGALVMVADLFATQGAGQESEIFRFASDVDADQRAEIKRMRTMQTPPNVGAPNR
jgi:uncharacterized protein (DUF305 family)